jgi:hypothetical protein
MQRLYRIARLQVIRHLYKPEAFGLAGAWLFNKIVCAHLAEGQEKR